MRWHRSTPVSVTEALPATVNTPFFTHAMTTIGVEPKAPPPPYGASTVANVVLRLAEQPQREVVVGGAGRGLSTVLDLHRVVKTGALLSAAAGLGALLNRGSEAKTALGAGTTYAPTSQSETAAQRPIL